MSAPAPPRALRITGYASLFGVKDLAGDVVEKGAFAKSLARRPARDIAMLHQHEAAQPVGRWDVVAEDGTGLFVVGRILAAHPAGAYASALVRAGALDGLSIGFRTVRAAHDPARQARRLTEIDLIEISLVAFPMLPAARLRPLDLTPALRPAA